MDLQGWVGQLRRGGETIASQVSGLEPAQARWRPSPEQWSILEVVNHLADEEVEDFRGRLDATLHRPEEPWDPIDPQRWVVDRRYQERGLDESLARFLAERARSLEWLSALKDPPWANTYNHPRLGAISALDLLASWVGHDLIHVRQINRLQRAYLVSSGYDPAYAGPW